MYDRRHGPADRRASGRGGRRGTDTLRSDAELLRLHREDLEAIADHEPDDDDLIADRPELASMPRPQFPPRK